MRYLLLLTLFFSPLLVKASEPAFLKAMNIQPSPSSTRINFILNKKTTGRIKYLPEAKQIIVEFSNTQKNFNMQNARLGGANVEAISSKALPNHTIQLIFMVKGNVRWVIRYLPNVNNNAVLQLDILSIFSKPLKVKPTININAQLRQSLEDDISQLLSLHASQHKLKQRQFTVVIDPGHGGKDVGAKGANGTYEKTVVLAIAKRLARMINQSNNMRAILTRQNDYFIPLRGRLKRARKDEADLFIAIHADAYFEKQARGASVYALSEGGATSEAARWLAQKDNYSELGEVELNTLYDRSQLLRSVLIDLAQTATIQDSLRLGKNVLNALDDISALHYKRVEQAPFMVLRSPDIPSILIETGFISNPIEEHRLSDPRYQEKLAAAIYRGISEFK